MADVSSPHSAPRLSEAERTEALTIAQRYSYPPTWDVAPINRANWLLLARAVCDLEEQLQSEQKMHDAYRGELDDANRRILELKEQYERLTQRPEWVTCDYQPEKREGDPGGRSCTEAMNFYANELSGLKEQLETALQQGDEARQLAHRQGETLYDLTVQIATLRHALKTVRAECDLPAYIAEYIGDALASSNESVRESEKTWGPERMRHDPA